MTSRGYFRIWALVAAALAFEFYALNFRSEWSLCGYAKSHFHRLAGLSLNPEPGKSISLWLGWSGIGSMLATNFYVLRKRLGFLQNLGHPGGWLDFHIFCGMLGPLLILFHTNFHLRGLVALSFWSMVISFASGIIGRYFYLQLLKQKSELDRDVRGWEATLAEYYTRVRPSRSPEGLARLKQSALELAGARSPGPGVSFRLLRCLASSVTGDIRLRLRLGTLAAELPGAGRVILRDFAVSCRRKLYLEQFQRIMGYWHAFHLPFAILMYVIAAIHITTALLLAVPEIS